MSPTMPVLIHASQFPEAVRRELVNSLQERQINHKFHYDSFKQSQKWLALHEAYSPARTQADCLATYDRSFAAMAKTYAGRPVDLIGLGCGGGQKDAELMNRLCAVHTDIRYVPVDVSVPLVITASQAAQSVVPNVDCCPLVCDLAMAEDLPNVFAALLAQMRASEHSRDQLFTFFGMIPNFQPDLILPRLRSLLQPRQVLLFSANLAPGSDYGAGVQQVLPQYDNDLTRDWLLTLLLDLGFEKVDGEVRFCIETIPAQKIELKRIAAYFKFKRAAAVNLDGERLAFEPGEEIRLFFSYRYTPALVKSLLPQYGLHVGEQWVTASGEEGVFKVQAGEP